MLQDLMWTLKRRGLSSLPGHSVASASVRPSDNHFTGMHRFSCLSRQMGKAAAVAFAPGQARVGQSYPHVGLSKKRVVPVALTLMCATSWNRSVEPSEPVP